MNYRSKIDLKEDVRLIEIPGYDVCACCGIHVARTGEIGIIKLVKIEKYKSGVRIYMLAGSKALEDYDNKYEQVSKISSLLSLKLDEVYDGVLNLTTEIDSLKKERNLLKSKIKGVFECVYVYAHMCMFLSVCACMQGCEFVFLNVCACLCV